MISLKKLRRYLSGIKSCLSCLLVGESGVYASMVMNILEKRTVLDMVEHLCELVLE